MNADQKKKMQTALVQIARLEQVEYHDADILARLAGSSPPSVSGARLARLVAAVNGRANSNDFRSALRELVQTGNAVSAWFDAYFVGQRAAEERYRAAEAAKKETP